MIMFSRYDKGAAGNNRKSLKEEYTMKKLFSKKLLILLTALFTVGMLAACAGEPAEPGLEETPPLDGGSLDGGLDETPANDFDNDEEDSAVIDNDDAKDDEEDNAS
jgi:hypothetical protein